MTAPFFILLSFFLFSCSTMEAAPIRKRVRIEELSSISEREIARSSLNRNERRFPPESVRTISQEEEIPTDLDENEEVLSSSEEDLLGGDSMPAFSVEPPLKRSQRVVLSKPDLENERFLLQHGLMAAALTELEERKEATEFSVKTPRDTTR